MPEDRLSELRRQKALLQQQAEQIEREIAAGEKTAGSAASPAGGDADKAPDAFSAYAPDPSRTRQQVKRGCLLYFLVVLALLGAVFFTFLYLRYRDRPMLFMEKDPPSPGSASAVQ